MKTRSSLRNIPNVDFALGDLVKDNVTGFEGVVTCHQRHLTGCDTVWVTTRDPNIKKEDLRERSFDVLRLTLIEKNPMKLVQINADVPAAG